MGSRCDIGILSLATSSYSMSELLVEGSVVCDEERMGTGVASRVDSIRLFGV